MKMEGGGGAISQLRQAMKAQKFLLYAILIYSDMNENIIQFLRGSRQALAKMGGKKVFLWWFEHFERDCKLLWEPRENRPPLRKKVFRNDSLELARQLEIPMSKTPCLVLCRTLDDGQALVYSLDNSWSHTELVEHFAAIFDRVEEVLGRFEKNRLLNIHDELLARLMVLKAKKWVGRLSSKQSFRDLLRAIATLDPTKVAG